MNNIFKKFKIFNHDISTYKDTEIALEVMKNLARDNIHCVLHNSLNGNLLTAIEIDDDKLEDKND